MSFAERSFHGLLESLPRREVPPALAPVLTSKRTVLGQKWMRRYEVEEIALRSAGFSLLLICYAVALPILVAILFIFGPSAASLAVLPALLSPVAVVSFLINAPESLAKAEERRILRETPAIVGGMTMSMQLQPSLERATLFASKRTEGVLAGRLREALWSSLTRAKGSVEEAVLDMTSSLSAVNDPLRQSLHLVMAATRERGREGMDRLLDKANSIALSGVRDAVDRYVASLSTPTMVLFSLGTLLPIMLFTLLPLLSLGSSLGTGGSGSSSVPQMAVLLLVVFPFGSMLYARSILQCNPLYTPRGSVFTWRRDALLLLAIWTAAVIAAFALELGEFQSYLQAAAVVLPPCAYLAKILRSEHMATARRSQNEKEMIGALFQVGNSMSAGAGMEEAVRTTAQARPGTVFWEMMRRVLHRSAMTGNGMEKALSEDAAIRGVSPLVQAAYLTVAECSSRDPRYAGQVALNLAQLLSDLNVCQDKIDEKLKGIVDMMRSTALVFGPIVLGVTSSLFAVVGGAEAVDDIVLMTGVYIAQLSLVVSHFTVFLQGEGSWKEVAYQFAVRTPISLAIFTAVSLISRTGLISLL